jgi:hypothetical protein
MDKKGEIKTFFILSGLALLIINLTLISSYLLSLNYGSLSLGSGEEYTVNIPFLTSSKSPVVCGTAEKTDGTPLQNVRVNITYADKTEVLGQTLTDKNGEYCITLPEINSNKRFDVYVEYDDATDDYLELASNDYKLDFEDDLVYSKSTTTYVPLVGEITNEDAEVEDGRFEIRVGYRVNGKWKYPFEDYQRYSINIESNDVYEIPNDELDFSWKIPSDAKTGEYKFYIKTSFNAKDHTKDVLFNITA